MVLYDADKKYIADLIEFTAGSRRGIEKNDFVVLPNKSKIGGKLSFIAGKTAWGQEIANSKGRKYYLQLVFHKVFLSSSSEIIPKNKNEMPEFYKTFMEKECCRSNIIKLRINKDKTNK